MILALDWAGDRWTRWLDGRLGFQFSIALAQGEKKRDKAKKLKSSSRIVDFIRLEDFFPTFYLNWSYSKPVSVIDCRVSSSRRSFFSPHCYHLSSSGYCCSDFFPFENERTFIVRIGWRHFSHITTNALSRSVKKPTDTQYIKAI